MSFRDKMNSAFSSFNQYLNDVVWIFDDSNSDDLGPSPKRKDFIAGSFLRYLLYVVLPIIVVVAACCAIIGVVMLIFVKIFNSFGPAAGFSFSLVVISLILSFVVFHTKWKDR